MYNEYLDRLEEELSALIISYIPETFIFNERVSVENVSLLKSILESINGQEIELCNMYLDTVGNKRIDVII